MRSSITGRTTIFTILAHPSTHVVAPMVYNHLFTSMDLDMVYISHDVDPEAIPETIRAFTGWQNLGGFNVTIPHKEAVAALLTNLCGISSLIGVVNIVVRNDDGSLHGYNTDGFGAVRALGDVKGASCLMLGAGGAARSIAYSLMKDGAERVLVMNRSKITAQRLCDLLGNGKVGLYGNEPLEDFSVIIQATPVAGEIPFGLDMDAFKPGTRVLETVMRHTELSRKASDIGLELIPGHAMLYHQTWKNFHLLTGIELDEKPLDDAFASVGYTRS
jgi:shikimate dehydrogenase